MLTRGCGELDQGVKGPPGGTDKDGGGTIWVAWSHFSSLSVAERLHFFHPTSEISFVFADNVMVFQPTWNQSPQCVAQF